MENEMIKFDKPLFSLKWLSIFGAIVIATSLALGLFVSTDADGAENVEYMEFPPVYITATPLVD